MQVTMQKPSFLTRIVTTAGEGNFTNSADNSRSCHQILMNFYGMMSPLAKKHARFYIDPSQSVSSF